MDSLLGLATRSLDEGGASHACGNFELERNSFGRLFTSKSLAVPHDLALAYRLLGLRWVTNSMNEVYGLNAKREDWTMAVVSMRVVLAAILAIAYSGTSNAGARAAQKNTRGNLQGKIEYCTYCHGASGQGYQAFYAMPRLAGQTPEYFDNQLQAYAERRRKNTIMYNVARDLSPAMRAALASHFAKLKAGNYGHGPSGLAVEGKRIFQEGVPNDNVPACAACHGTEAQGFEQNPRLAGQLNSYLQKTLANWNKERGHDADASDPASIMQPVARNLNKSQAAAVAAYLSSLK